MRPWEYGYYIHQKLFTHLTWTTFIFRPSSFHLLQAVTCDMHIKNSYLLTNTWTFDKCEPQGRGGSAWMRRGGVKEEKRHLNAPLFIIHGHTVWELTYVWMQ